MTYRIPATMPEPEPEPEPKDRIEKVHHCSLPWRWPWRFRVDDLFHCRCGKTYVMTPRPGDFFEVPDWSEQVKPSAKAER